MSSTAVILAGGFGTRLRSVIADVPKPMAPVNGKPFLEYVMKYLLSHQVKNIILATGYLAEKIESYFGDHYCGAALYYSKEDQPLGTGGAIRKALLLSGDDNIIVVNGDSLFRADIHQLIKIHESSGVDATIALRYVEDSARYGTITVDRNGTMISFREKSGEQVPGLINGGVYILRKEAYLKKTPGGTFSIEKDYFEKYLSERKFRGLSSDAYFIDIGIPEDFHRAQDEFKGTEHQ